MTTNAKWHLITGVLGLATCIVVLEVSPLFVLIGVPLITITNFIHGRLTASHPSMLEIFNRRNDA